MAQGVLTARRLDGDGVRISWRDGRIAALERAEAPADVAIAPLLCDPQVNGYGAVDFQDDAMGAADLERAVGLLRRDGCGEILLTLTTAPWDALVERLRRRARERASSPTLTRAIAGWHIEGPFMSGEPGYRGAHPAERMIDPSPERIRALHDAGGGLPMLLTLAPERAGAIESIREAARLGIVVSLGHTNATAQRLADAHAAGARAFTHLGNGIPQQLDRHDNLLWRVLDGPPLTVGLIPDAIHVSPQAFRILHRAGVDAYYTTDCIAAAGMPPGRYTLGGTAFDVGADQVVRLPGASNFAGSALRPLQGVFRAAKMLGRPWRECWSRAADAPRRLMRLPDPLRLGAPADFCVVRGGDAPTSIAVFVDGAEFARHEPAPI